MKAKQEKAPANRKLAVRITEEDYQKLCELRLALHLPSDGAAIRAIIRLHHKHATGAIHRARRDPGHKNRVQALVDRRQLEMFPKGASKCRTH